MPFTQFIVPGKPDHFTIFPGGTISLGLRAVYPGVQTPLTMTVDYTIDGPGTTFPDGSTSLQHSQQISGFGQQDFPDHFTLIHTGDIDSCIINITGTFPDGTSQSDNINVQFVQPLINALHPDMVAELVDKISDRVRLTLPPVRKRRSPKQ